MAEPRAHNQSSTGDPVAWFAVMEHARRRGDFERAATAKRMLTELGVKVTYTTPSANREKREKLNA